MRLIKYLTLSLAAVLAMSLGAFAKDSNSAKFDLSERATVGSTILQPGHYKAEWTGPKDALQVSIEKNGKTVATVAGKLKELPQAAPYNSVTLKTLANNKKQVDEIDFNNRTEALVLGGM
jgi:hypothetical protein